MQVLMLGKSWYVKLHIPPHPHFYGVHMEMKIVHALPCLHTIQLMSAIKIDTLNKQDMF